MRALKTDFAGGGCRVPCPGVLKVIRFSVVAFVCLAGGLAVGLTLGQAALAQSTGLERTEPGHMPPVPPGGYDLPLAPPVMRFPLPPQWVTIRTKDDWRKAGAKVNKKLSDACAAGRFREVQALHYRAIFKNVMFGVAFGHGLNLYDPRKLAQRSMIYLFRDGDSTACTVMEITNQDARITAEASGNQALLPGPDGKVGKNPAKGGN